MPLEERDYLAVGRGAVLARNGIVSSVIPLAAEAGTHVMKQGGNAFDAAIAVAMVEDVVLPSFCGLGGEVFALLYEASSGTLYGLTGSGRAPMTATADYFKEKGFERLPRDGALASTIPGEVDALWTIHDRFGSGKFSFSQLMEPAIGYADEGFAVPQRNARYGRLGRDRLLEDPHTAQFMMNNGEPYLPGEVMVQKNLAKTLKRVADGGRDEFYKGGVGEELIKALQEGGSLYTMEDLAAHETLVYDDPVSISYRGYTVYETKLPSQGIIVLQGLNLLEQFDLQKYEHNSADYIHLLTEIKHKVFADRTAFYGDPEYVQVPVDALLSKEYAKERAGTIDLSRAANNIAAGVLPTSVTSSSDGSTSYFSIADREGNWVSLIHSVFAIWGSCFIPGDLGFMMNTRAMSFSLKEGEANSLMPSKRPLHTLNCFMIFKDGKPYLTGGTPGADFQPLWNIQTIARVLDFNMDVQRATEEPRFIAAAPGGMGGTEFEIQLEKPLLEDASLVKDLEAKGHKVGIYSTPGRVGALALVAQDHETGVYMGGADPREDGQVSGF